MQGQTNINELNLEQALSLHYEQLALLQQTQQNVQLLVGRIEQLKAAKREEVAEPTELTEETN